MKTDETLNEETASEQEEAGSAEQDEQLADDQSQVDYQSLYEKAEQDRKNLESLIGRQGNELGELRELIKKSQIAGDVPADIDPNQFFDEETLRAIDKIAENKAQRIYESKTKEAEEKNLKADFNAVVSEYEITEENLPDLAYYAATKGLPLKKAADELAKKQLLDKRTKPRTQNNTFGAAPTGAPRVATSSGGIARDPLKMSPEEFKKLSDEEVERLGQKYYNRH
jgi:hypothetical protein